MANHLETDPHDRPDSDRLTNLSTGTSLDPSFMEALRTRGLTPMQEELLGKMATYGEETLLLAQEYFSRSLTIEQIAIGTGYSFSHVSHCLEAFNAWLGWSTGTDAQRRMEALKKRVEAKYRYWKVMHGEELTEAQAEQLEMMKRYDDLDAFRFARMYYEKGLTPTEIAKREGYNIWFVKYRLSIFNAWMGWAENENARNIMTTLLAHAKAKHRYREVMRGEELTEAQAEELENMQLNNPNVLSIMRMYYEEEQTIQEIAKRVGFSAHRISRYLRAFNAWMSLTEEEGMQSMTTLRRPLIKPVKNAQPRENRKNQEILRYQAVLNGENLDESGQNDLELMRKYQLPDLTAAQMHVQGLNRRQIAKALNCPLYTVEELLAAFELRMGIISPSCGRSRRLRRSKPYIRLEVLKMREVSDLKLLQLKDTHPKWYQALISELQINDEGSTAPMQDLLEMPYQLVHNLYKRAL